jgi:hypothetical protein
MQAHEAVGEERARLWHLVTGESRFYAGFQRKTTRLDPAVRSRAGTSPGVTSHPAHIGRCCFVLLTASAGTGSGVTIVGTCRASRDGAQPAGAVPDEGGYS